MVAVVRRTDWVWTASPLSQYARLRFAPRSRHRQGRTPIALRSYNLRSAVATSPGRLDGGTGGKAAKTSKASGSDRRLLWQRVQDRQ